MSHKIFETQSHIIHMHFSHADSLQNKAVKRELFHDKFNDTALDLLDQLGKLSGKHDDLYRLKLGMNTQPQLKLCDNLTGQIRKENLIRQRNFNTLNCMIEEVKQEPNLEEAYNIHLKGKTQIIYSEFWASIATTIASIKKNYVDFYSSLMLKYADFYQAYTELQSKLAGAVSEGKDGNYIKWDESVMSDAFKKFRDKIDSFNKNLGSVPQWDQLSKTERQQMADMLKPAFTVDMSTGKITFDQQALDNCPKSPSGASGSGKSDVNMASYNAWLAAFNSMSSTFQSNMQSFSQRYTQANSSFDNLNKVLSSSITALLECAKAFLSN